MSCIALDAHLPTLQIGRIPYSLHPGLLGCFNHRMEDAAIDNVFFRQFPLCCNQVKEVPKRQRCCCCCFRLFHRVYLVLSSLFVLRRFRYEAKIVNFLDIYTG